MTKGSSHNQKKSIGYSHGQKLWYIFNLQSYSFVLTKCAHVYSLVAPFDNDVSTYSDRFEIYQLIIWIHYTILVKNLNSRRYIFTHECRQFPPNLCRRRTSSFLSVGPFLVQISMQMNASKQVLFFQVNKWDWLLAYLFDENWILKSWLWRRPPQREKTQPLFRPLNDGGHKHSLETLRRPYHRYCKTQPFSITS